jgi:hypothetical protein
MADTVDAVAGFDERRRGNLSTRTKLVGPVGVLGVAALGRMSVTTLRRGVDGGFAAT